MYEVDSSIHMFAQREPRFCAEVSSVEFQTDEYFSHIEEANSVYRRIPSRLFN